MQDDVNIISVDWAPGAKSPYLKATANARLAGAQLARMITYLEQKGGLNIQDVHVIAHSLGGHVAGYAGDRLMGRIPRITGRCGLSRVRVIIKVVLNSSPMFT